MSEIRYYDYGLGKWVMGESPYCLGCGSHIDCAVDRLCDQESDESDEGLADSDGDTILFGSKSDE